MERDNTLNLVIVGHVDHGKSTLIGRLLYETNSLPRDKIKEIERACANRGKRTEFAYLLDHFAEERTGGITIDTTQVFFNSEKSRFVIIDAPGHVEFIKNMITGASQADAAVLIIDASEGIKEQTKRHSYIISLLGLSQVIVVLNKMDIVNFKQDCFNTLKEDIQKWLKQINISPVAYVPISAISGDNIVKKSKSMSWYNGPTVLQALDNLNAKPSLMDSPLILPIQDVYKINTKPLCVGKIETGSIAKGDCVKILPHNFITKVNALEKFLETTERAFAGECIGIKTADDILLNRGSVICSVESDLSVSNRIDAKIFWMSETDLTKQQPLTLKCATQQSPCEIESINKRIEPTELKIIETNAERIKKHEVAEVTIKTQKPIVTTNFNKTKQLGRFVLLHDDNIYGGGIVMKTTRQVKRHSECLL